ncbi:two-component system sensor histidine kinase NtrB [Thermosulfuriphilus sp.]
MPSQPSLKRVPFFLLVLLLVFTVAMVLAIYGSYRLSVRASQDLLATRALDIAIGVEFLLHRDGIDNVLLFEDILKSGRWDDLAFLALYDADGEILLHSNPNLIEEEYRDPAISKVFEKRRPLSHFIRLRTGEEVFVFDLPVHLRTGTRGPYYVLRVALHTYPARWIVRQARIQGLLMGASLFIIWGLGVLGYRSWRRSEELAEEVRQAEHLAALGQLAAVLAHEIRNPLGSIKGFAQLMRERIGRAIFGSKPLTPETLVEIQADLATIVSEATRLEKLTRDLLSYARPSPANKTEIDLGILAAETVRSLRQNETLESKRIKLREHLSEVRLFSDPEKIKQILINLLTNALEAAPEGGEILVQVGREGDKALLAVGDNGPGIAPEDQERIFEPFFTTKAKGSGLGLAIVKRLASVLGGQITVYRKNGFTFFELRLPLESEAQ